MRTLFSKPVLSTKKALAALTVLATIISGCGDDEPKPPSLTDIDGNVYETVAIGNQVWMAENLQVAKYNDGSPIPYVTNDDDVSILTTGAYTWYDKNPANRFTYGALYNWHSVSSGNLCPIGWHVPSDAEWTTLINFLGGEDIAGGKLKDIGTSHWSAPNQDATNDSGFTALPAGYLFDNGNYNSLGNITHWWSSTESGGDSAWDRYVYFQNGNAIKGDYSKQVFFSCRCLKD